MAELTREIIDAEHYVARYARGSLSKQEAESFEEFCLLHPEVVQDVRVDRAMRKAMKAIGSQENNGRRRFEWQPLAIAASVLLATILISLQFWRADSSRGALYADSTNLPAIARAHIDGPFALVRQRGTGVQVLQVAPGATALGLEFELPAGGTANRYQLALEESVEDAWVPRGKLEVNPATANGTRVVRAVVDLGEVGGSRLRLTFSAPNGERDAFELRLEPTR